MELMIHFDAFAEFWYMKLVYNLSTQHNMNIISFKVLYFEQFFSVILLKTFIMSFAIKSLYSFSGKIRFLGDVLVDEIFGRAGL